MKNQHMKALFREVSCCICLSRNQSRFYKKINDYKLLHCKKCKIVYMDRIETNPINFLEDANVDSNKKAEYWGYPVYFKKYESIFEMFFRERFQRIQSNNPPFGEWLDIGTGFGLWQTFLNKKNIKNFGIEIEQNAFNYSVSIGLAAENISIEDFSSSKKFAVITICDVLEHVESPIEILNKCKDMLIEGGLIYIQVPNVLGFKIPFGDHLGLPHHIWQFSPQPLTKLCEISGFKKINIWTGIQGVIGYHERNKINIVRKMIWKLAKIFKIGNRLQILIKK